MTRKVSGARRPGARTRRTPLIPEPEKKPLQNRPNASTKRSNYEPVELNAAKSPTERGALHGKHQSMTAEQRPAREASSPPPQNKTSPTAEHESEPVQEDDEGTMNDETPAETTIEHSNPNIGETESGSERTPSPEFIQQPRSFIQQDPERSEKMSKQQALFKLQTTVRELRKYDFSYAAIERITTVPRATAHLWASDVEPIPRQGDGDASRPKPDTTSSNATPSQPVNNDDFQLSHMPRISSEVLGPRPKVVEDNNGYGGYEQSSSASMDGGQTISSQPVDVDILRLLFSRQPEWIEVFLSIKAASVAAGYSDPIKFFHEQILKDREDADFFRAAVPHELGDEESLRENFMLIVRQASAYQEAAKKNGLEMRKTVELS